MSRTQSVLSDDGPFFRIKAALGTRDMAWLSRETGIATSTLSDIGKGKMPRTDRAIRIAIALGTTVEALFGAVHSGDTRDQRLTYDFGPEVADQSISEDDLVGIRQIDMAYGMGGTFADQHVDVKLQRFSRDWVRMITSRSADSLTWTRGRGDSMGETIRHDDVILLDLSDKIVREQDLIWAFTVGEMAMIKRLRVNAAGVTILSDNPLVPPDTANHEDVNIVGRVVFIGRRY